MRTKMRCISITKSENGNNIVLKPVSSGSPENELFFKWTPYGEVSLGIVKDEVAQMFVPGKEYYVDFSEA